MHTFNTFLSRLWGWFWATNTVLNWPLSKIIELRGNYIWVDGAQLSLDSYRIPTIKKFNLARTYELPERRLAKLHLEPDLPLIELGGFIGGVACITNRLLKTPDRHLVVEANPAIIGVLQHNKELNNAKFNILHGAIGYGREEFYISDSGMSTTASVKQEASSTPVKAWTLKRILDDFDYEQVCLICDIEGGEVQLIEHEINVLEQHVMIIIMETHPDTVGKANVDEMLSALFSKGFSTIDQLGDVYVFTNKRLKQ